MAGAHSMGCVAMFGAGGAGAAVAYALMRNGRWPSCSSSTANPVAPRILRRAWAPCSAVASRRGRTRPQPCRRADGIVNATPIGMAKYPGTPFDTALLTAGQWVADIIYFPTETEFLRRGPNDRLPHAAGHRHGGLSGRPRVRTVHRAQGRPPAMAGHFEAAA